MVLRQVLSEWERGKRLPDSRPQEVGYIIVDR